MTLPRRNHSEMREKVEKAMRVHVGGERKDVSGVVDTAIEQRDGTRRGCNDFEGSKGRGGGGKRIVSVGPALSSIAGGPH